MEICFLIHDITARAGTERAQANLANALRKCGERVSIWSCYGRRNPPSFPLVDGVELFYGLRRRLPMFLDYPWLICTFAFFILRRRPVWIVCTDTNRLIVALLAAFVPGVRLAAWEHFAIAHSVTKARGKLARWLAARLATCIVTLTKRDAEEFLRHFAPKGTITTIPNILSLPPLQPKERRKEVLAIGRLVPQKGFDLLCRAWALSHSQLPDWSLRIVGEGAARDELRLLVSTLGIEARVQFSEYSANPFSLYSECGIFVLSSRFEGLPFTLIEAMACSAPCISFDCPNGPREVIRDGENGMLIPAKNVRALADALVKLGRDPILRCRLGDEAQHIAKAYSEAQIAALWQAVLAL